MMSETKSSPENSAPRKWIVPIIAGGLAGFLSSFFITFNMDGWFGEAASLSRQIAAIVGGLYVIIATGVGVGAASPALGEKYLNTEDADEILEMRTVLMNSGAAMALWGIALMVLAFAAPDGPIPSAIALAVSVTLLLVGAWFGWRSHKVSDELFAAVNLEATAWAYGGTVTIGGGWSIAAHLQMTTPLAPLDWMTLFFAVALIASFVSTGLRGMLKLK